MLIIREPEEAAKWRAKLLQDNAPTEERQAAPRLAGSRDSLVPCGLAMAPYGPQSLSRRGNTPLRQLGDNSPSAYRADGCTALIEHVGYLEGRDCLVPFILVLVCL